MGAPKISATENEPRNLTMGTLIRLAHTLGSRWRLNWCAGKGRRRGGGEIKSKAAASANTSGAQTTRFKPNAAAPCSENGSPPPR
jgi:hypothetical protein